VAFSALPGALPAGIELDGALSVFVDVATNAMTSGSVRLCLGYPDANDDQIVDGTAVAVSRLRLLHAAGDRVSVRRRDALGRGPACVR
jgi:hypothetical protein